MSKRFFKVILVAGLIYLSPALGADFQTGVDAYTQGDYASALSIFQELAAQGHTDAQNNLGVMYNTGKGVSQDNAEAARWYRMAAERGHADAQSNLASLYVTGRGVPQDYVQAYAWFNLAAEQGDRSAASNRDFVANRLSPEELREAQQMSLMTSPGDASPVAAAPLTPPVAQPSSPPVAAAPPPAPPVAAAPPPAPPQSSAPQPLAPPANPPPATAASTTMASTSSAALQTMPAPAVAPPPPSSTAIAPATAPPVPVSSASTTGRVYGPVAKGTTLWSIAKSVNPAPDITTHQMVLALQRANPEAFSRPNINFLRIGARLRIPDAAEIRRIDPASAKAEVQRQLAN